MNKEIISDDCIEKLERVKTLLTEIKELKEGIFGKQGNTFEEIKKSADEYYKEHRSSFFT